MWLTAVASKSLIEFTIFQLLLVCRCRNVQNEGFQHESGVQHAVVGMPSLGPLHETSVGHHSLVVCTPTLFHHRVRDCFNKREPVGISLAKLEVRKLVFSRERRIIQEHLADARAIGDVFIFDVLIGFYVIQSDSHKHRQQDEHVVDCHLDEAVRSSAGVRVEGEG